MKIPQPSHSPHTSPSASDDRISVLVVDDDPHVADVLITLLEDEGFAVHHATDGLVALALIERQQPMVVLADIRMPNMDGVALVREIRARWQSIRVILMSASESPGDLVVPFVHKPFDLDVVLNLISECSPSDYSSRK